MLKLKEQENKQFDKLFITIGSNIDPQININSAIKYLTDSFGKIKLSKLYKSPAIVGPHTSESQKDYINGAILTYSNLPSNHIKYEILRKIENKLGRVRTYDKYASRTIDLDIAFYGSIIIDEPNICIPDPDIIQRAHLLSPLCDLDPEYIHPTENISLKELRDQIGDSNLEIFNI